MDIDETPRGDGRSEEEAEHSALSSSTATQHAQTSTAVALRNPLTDLTLIPTLLPTSVANLVTALSTSVRVSLRVAAFFIEAILETSQYSTRLSLGYTRRILITAISSARRAYLMSTSALSDSLTIPDKLPSSSTSSFLSVLDKYTNLGIYLIHHTFTLAELFTMSGFYLTANAVHSAHFAAQESVQLFDSLFGSNESSRALSSIITMVRREFLEDERLRGMDIGKVGGLAALTKALTAFACLQNATWRRTSERLKMKVLYDCTVVTEKDESFKSKNRVTVHDNLAAIPAVHASNAVPGPGPSTMASREARSHTPLDEVNGRLWDHLRDTPTGSRSDADRQDLDDVWDLEDLVGESGDEEYDGPPTEQDRRRRKLKRLQEDVLEITDEMRESTVVTQLLERLPRHVRRQSAPLPDVTVEDADEDMEVRVRTSVNTPRRLSLSSSENDWIEVDQLLEEEEDVPEIPNGSSSVGTRSFRDAIEHPTANSERIQLVLKTMTNKLLQRRRIIKRIKAEEGYESSDSTLRKKTSVTVSARPDVRRIEWSEGWSPGRASPTTAKSTDSGPSTPLVSEQTPTRISRSLSSSSSSGKQPLRNSPIRRVQSRARQAIKPLTTQRRASRTSSPEPSELLEVDDQSTPSVPPPTPYVPLTSERKAPSDTRRNHHRNRLSITALHDSTRTSETRVQAAGAHIVPGGGEDEGELYPHDSLVRNIHRFMRYSSAAYGQNFLRILGLGNSDYNFSSTARHHANSWAFAQHTNIPIDSLLLSSYTEATPAFGSQKAAPLVHYVSVEHQLKTVVLTCRGTLGLSDVLIDLTCDYRTIQLEGGDPDADYYVHSGMYQSALTLTARRSTVHQTLIDALNKYPSYGLVICGHSLGGGVAALLSIASSQPSSTFLKQNASRSHPIPHPKITTRFVTSFNSGLPPGRPIHCYAYGPPAVASPDLARYTKGLITSVVQNSDIVPCLSLGVLRDLKNVAVTLAEEGHVAEEIVGRVIGIYQRKFSFQNGGEGGMDEPSDDEVLADWMMSLIKTMRADMDNDKLFPPGNVYILEYFDVFVPGEEREEREGVKLLNHKQGHRVILRQCESVEERFREPLFTKTMLNDHLPSHYERSTQLLFDGMGHGKM